MSRDAKDSQGQSETCLTYSACTILECDGKIEIFSLVNPSLSPISSEELDSSPESSRDLGITLSVLNTAAEREQTHHESHQLCTDHLFSSLNGYPYTYTLSYNVKLPHCSPNIPHTHKYMRVHTRAYQGQS